ncbi:hypothetical protein RIF29_24266 [Crotalaria pallida]|uniref:Uncharacterized protein n=1 Tax=Crotalaria pallida TaxID=3830 RepID=A0AAN9HYQ8_CROPI
MHRRRTHGGLHCRTWWQVEFTPCDGFLGGSRGGRDGSRGGACISCGVWRPRVVDCNMSEGDLVVVGCRAVVPGGGIMGTSETREGDGGGSVFLPFSDTEPVGGGDDAGGVVVAGGGVTVAGVGGCGESMVDGDGGGGVLGGDRDSGSDGSEGGGVRGGSRRGRALLSSLCLFSPEAKPGGGGTISSDGRA